MSTDEMEKQIQNLLGSLRDESLGRSRNSVKISFTQMLDYIDEIRKPIREGGIKRLLETYKVLPEKYDLLLEKYRELIAERDIKLLLETYEPTQEKYRELHPDRYIRLLRETYKLPLEKYRELIVGDNITLPLEKYRERIVEGDIKLLLETYNVLLEKYGLLIPDADYTLLLETYKVLREKYRELIAGDEITLLLQTYREMAEKFYTQYELSLLDEIKKHGNVQIQSELVIKKIESLQDADTEKKVLETAIPLLEKAYDDAAAEYRELIRNFPTLLQNALDKLKDEWQRLYAIAVASKTLTEDDDLIQALREVVEYAAFSVGIEAERIAIVPGDAFALNFFTYLENFAVLTVPIYSVQAPWEWSIFWHELAGYKVRQLEKDTALPTIGENLKLLHDLFKPKESRVFQHEIFSLLMEKNHFSRKYISDLFDKDELDLSDLGSFEHQFERMLANLPTENKFQNYEQIKADGWCVDWFKELFEDAWSVLAIGEDFLLYFKDILSRHDTTDGRHPPLEVRLSVTNELLKLADPESKVENQPKLVETIAAQQILKFMSLIITASYYKSFNLEFEILDQKLIQECYDRSSFHNSVRTEITDAISYWSTNFLAEDASADEIKKYATDFISVFYEKLGGTETLASIEKKKIVPSYVKLLEGLDYKQLLDISFYDIDYGVSSVANVYYNTVKKFNTAKLTSNLANVTMGAVTYESGGIKKRTSIESWNTAAAPDYKI